MSRYCLSRSATETPEKVALILVSDVNAPVHLAEYWTYAQMDKAVRRVAAGLLQMGIEPGSRITIRMDNTSDYIILFFGAIAAGCVPLPSSAQLTKSEVYFLLSDSGSSVIAMSEDLAITPPSNVIALDCNDIMLFKNGDEIVDYADTDAADPAFLIYTSGTTGTPKGVLHAHRSAWGRRPMYNGWYEIKPSDIILHAGAFNWTYTIGVGITDPWANGATAVLYNGPREATVWPLLMEKFHASLFAAVPSLYRKILKYNKMSSFDLSSLRYGLTAGEVLSISLLQEWQKATGRELYEAFGMSECSTYISSSPSMTVRPGSPGKPQPGRCIVVLPLEGGEEPLPPCATGLLAVHRSDPGLMLGYWQRPDEEALVYRGEWFIGGDLAQFDSDGYMIYQGRNDDIMNVMGYRVSPLEVEHCLSQHSAVSEVAVTEIVVHEGVSIIVAFVVLYNPNNPDKTDTATLLAYASRHLAAYKCPREIIFTGSLPHTTNGKIRRCDLAQMWYS
jgi:acyl-coenzyme A synthetase/AMP-(fatty) acid ligase